MHAVRQSCRPKHQILILKCYPRYQKNVTEVKPNSSELSYLLYYASTRRSKLQKVGSFLEKKTTSDVHKGKIGNVQVTLRILKALIEKLPRDLPLYARYVLQILRTILRSKDISLAEDSIALFETFCQHHDIATLAADQEQIASYEDVVRSYAGFASQNAASQANGNSALSAPMAIRWRAVALSAIRSITASEAVGADGGTQMNIVLPVILQTLRPDDEDFFWTLQQRAHTTDALDKESNLKRRISNATLQTVDEASRPDSATISATTDDADRVVEEEVGMQALRSLKQIFVANNRAQIRIATASMIRYLCTRVSRRSQPPKDGVPNQDRKWAATIIEIVTRWTPVQDRFIILVTIIETLVRSPIAEENLEQQLLLATLVEWLLKSSINMIGLSVMDVLLGLIQHILLILQLGGQGSNVLPHHQQTDAIDLFQETSGLVGAASSEKPGTIKEVSSPSFSRHELLDKLQHCIGNLATHVYYSDQVSDIISAILLRLKPSAASGVSTIAAAIEHPQAAAQAIANSVQLQENPKTDDFFSFGTARVTALKAIKDVILTANAKSQSSGGTAVGRNKVGLHVWEGTQWLLRDEDRRVRRAYVDALLTWLKLEMSKTDLRVMEDKRQRLSSRPSKIGDTSEWGQLTRRAVSNASHREKSSKPAKSSFLQLLHLAVYDNALETPESEADLLLLHLLLANLVEKLGVNAVKDGLPMILRLQEDINVDTVIASPTAKLNIGSLVHGYLWILDERFDLDGTRVGYEIQAEISRRKRHKLWLSSIRLPAVPLDAIMVTTSTPFSEQLPLPIIQQEALKPFDSRESLVDRIAIAYTQAIASPPVSPPTSPGRTFSLPVLSTSGPVASDELPSTIKDAMLVEWSKEMCIASVEKETSKSVSLSGSRTGTNLSARALALGLNGNSPRNGSPSGGQSPTGVSPVNGSTPPYAQQGLSFPFKQNSGPDNGSPTPVSSSDHSPTLRVDDLKRVLASGSLGIARYDSRGASPLRHSSAPHRDHDPPDHRRSISSSSESAISAEGFESASEGDISRPLPPPVPNPLLSEKPTSIIPGSEKVSSPHHAIQQQHKPVTATPTTSRPQTASSRAHSFRGDSNDPHPHPSPKSPSRSGHYRPSTSSSSATEDPAVTVMALRGEVVPPAVIGGDSVDEEVPPVPPLPASVALQKSLGGDNALAFKGNHSNHVGIGAPPSKSGSAQPLPLVAGRDDGAVIDDSPTATSGSFGGNDSIGTGRSSMRLSKRGKRVTDVEKLLGSIDAVAGAGGGGGGGGTQGKRVGSGRPPY
ncbi:MAG: hypothetical protein Q9220_006042 [cf. Caloplaca sp. 1 TL-2023]